MLKEESKYMYDGGMWKNKNLIQIKNIKIMDWEKRFY